jgi:hypothetical protein
MIGRAPLGRNNSLDAAVHYQIIAQRIDEIERDLPVALTRDAEPADWRSRLFSSSTHSNSHILGTSRKV